MQTANKLRVYSQAELVAVEVYRVVRLLPFDERFALGQQLRRAAVSVGSNIAEGTGRDSNRDLCRFLFFALGSSAEVEFQLRLVVALDLATAQQVQSARDQCEKMQRMLIRLIQRVRPSPKHPEAGRKR